MLLALRTFLSCEDLRNLIKNTLSLGVEDVDCEEAVRVSC